MKQAKSRSGEPNITAVDVQTIHFTPEAYMNLNRLAECNALEVGPGLLCGRRYGSALLIEQVVTYKTVLHSCTYPRDQSLLYAMAWWRGYRYALYRETDTQQLGWLLQFDGVLFDELTLSLEDIASLQANVFWQIEVDTHGIELTCVFVLNTFQNGQLLIRAFALDPESAQAREIRVDTSARA